MTNGFALQILRQYALLANLVHKIFVPSKDNDSKQHDTEAASSTSTDKSQRATNKEKSGVVILSNQNPNEQKLDALLGEYDMDENIWKSKDAVPGGSEANPRDDVKIDITLRTQLGQAPVLILLFTFNDETPENDSKPESDYSSRISISFEVGLNGHISVVDTSGLCHDQPSSDENKEGQDKASELQGKIARALEVSQDLGTLVEWVLRWRRQRKSA